MSPPSPTILDKKAGKPNNAAPVGWEAAKFPLSKLDLSKIGQFHPRKTRRCLYSRKNSSMALKSSAQILQNVAKSPRFNIGRQKGSFSGVRSPRVSPRISPRTISTGNVRLVSRTDSGWSWLSVKFKEIRANKSFKPRKGELPPELIEAIWGFHNMRHCQLSKESLRSFSRKRVSIDPELEIKKIRAKRLDRDGQVKSADSLMDILLRNWTYFAHSHSTLGKTEKDVHAKYCEDEFGHFLLSNGEQIHGQFNVNLHVLIRDLRKLMIKLRSQILPTAYQAEIAITHFDVIMYSFDAWSFGDIENSYIYKQSAASRYMRPLEPMRVKSPETFEGALNWVSRWRTNGPANLSKAIELACSRASVDCIYVFTEGKSDKPVLVSYFFYSGTSQRKVSPTNAHFVAGSVINVI